MSSGKSVPVATANRATEQDSTIARNFMINTHRPTSYIIELNPVPNAIQILTFTRYRSAHEAMATTGGISQKAVGPYKNCQPSAGLQKNIEPLIANTAHDGNPQH
jgi:hypothetical protein